MVNYALLTSGHNSRQLPELVEGSRTRYKVIQGGDRVPKTEVGYKSEGDLGGRGQDLKLNTSSSGSLTDFTVSGTGPTIWRRGLIPNPTNRVL